MVSVITGWRLYKSFQIYRVAGTLQAAKKPIAVYLAKSTAVGTVIATGVQMVAVKAIDYYGGKPDKPIPVEVSRGRGIEVLHKTTSRGKARKLGLRSTDEAAAAIVTAVYQTGRWRKFSDTKQTPEILRQVIVNSGITLQLGVATPDIVYKVVKTTIPKDKRFKARKRTWFTSDTVSSADLEANGRRTAKGWVVAVVGTIAVT